MAVADRGTDPCGKELHLVILIGRSIVEIEPGRPAKLGNGRSYNRHKVNEVVIKKDIDTGNEPAGVIDQCDYANAVLLPVFCL